MSVRLSCLFNYNLDNSIVRGIRGRPQRRGRGLWSNVDTCGQGRGVKNLADVCKLVLFFIVSACFADTLYVDDAY